MTEEPPTVTCKYCFKKTERNPEGECTHCHFAHPDFLLPPEEHDDDEWIRDARAVLQGIAEMEPWEVDSSRLVDPGSCFFCGIEADVDHLDDCLWLRAEKLVGVK